MGQRQLFLIAVTFLQVLSASSKVHAQGANATLDLIGTTADRICGVVVLAGSATSTDAKGAVNVELKGLASQLENAGVQGSGGITTQEYQGSCGSSLGMLFAYYRFADFGSSTSCR
jgi:hypothetical protein